MTQKQPSDFNPKEWSWTPYMDGSYGLLSSIVYGTDSAKSNSEIYKKTKDSIDDFEQYIDQSNPQIGKIVTAQDFQRLFRGNISEQVLSESFGLNNSDGKPIGPSIELLIAKRLAKMQKGLANFEKTSLRKATPPPSSPKVRGTVYGRGRFRGLRSISGTSHALQGEISDADQQFTDSAPSAFYDIVHPTDPTKRLGRVHWGVAFGNLLGSIASTVPVVGHILNLYTAAYAHSEMGHVRESLKNPDIHLAAAKDTPLITRLWDRLTFNTHDDVDPAPDPAPDPTHDPAAPAPPPPSPSASTPTVDPPPPPASTTKVTPDHFAL